MCRTDHYELVLAAMTEEVLRGVHPVVPPTDPRPPRLRRRIRSHPARPGGRQPDRAPAGR